MSPNQLVKTDFAYFLPFNRYVVSEHEFHVLTEHTPNTNWEWSSFNSYERRYGGQDLNGKTVCIYRHSAFGDQLMVSAVPHYLKARYPGAKIHLYCHPSVHGLWLHNPFVEGSALPIPLPFDAVKRYDYHIFYEGMLEGNSERDQSCCYDDMFDSIGCRSVPASFKRPFFITRPEDYEVFNRMALKRPYLVYHLSPANPNRMYPWKLGQEFIRMFHDSHPDWLVVLVGQKQQANGKVILVNDLNDSHKDEYPWFVDLTDQTPNFRHLAPFIENAGCVVCPDSSVLHLAACYPEVPVYSLWGLFHPDDRAKYYSNNHSIMNPGICPHMPCRDHNFVLPVEKCSHAQGTDTEHCRVLASIAPSWIADVIQRGGVR
jgi:ADP-heptose:LPS heptosyltransferase